MLIIGNLESIREGKWKVNIPRSLSTTRRWSWYGSISSFCVSGIMPPSLAQGIRQWSSNQTSPGEEDRLPSWRKWTLKGLYNLATIFDLISHVALNTVQDTSPAPTPLSQNWTSIGFALVFVCSQNWPCFPQDSAWMVATKGPQYWPIPSPQSASTVSPILATMQKTH